MSRSILFCSVIALAFSLSGCLEDKCLATRQYTVYQPVYAKMEEFRQEVRAESPRELRNTGALYIYGQYIFINEKKEGIHIIDNTDPAHPSPIAFLNIAGNFSLAVRNNLLYADNYVDLVVMDISDPLNVQFAGRTENVFPSYGFYEELGHLVYYEKTNETIEVNCANDNYQRGGFWLENGSFASVDDLANGFSKDATAAESGSANSIGLSGSLARFNIIDKYLYSVSEYDLNIFDLTNPTEAELASTVNVGWGIETIFPYQDKLFIGANNGMYIYDNSDPLHPTQLSLFQHATACDPVFVSGDLAYVTLRDGTECQSFTNQLDVVDISNLTAPQLLVTYPMENPHGLSVAEDRLYLCEGRFGFKVFDATDWRTLGSRQKVHLKDFNAQDVIILPARDLAIVVGADGLHQFDITDPDAPQLLSVLRTGER